MSSIELATAQGAIDRQFDYESMFQSIEQINRDNQVSRPITKQAPLAMKSVREASASLIAAGGFAFLNFLIPSVGVSSLLNIATVFTFSFGAFC